MRRWLICAAALLALILGLSKSGQVDAAGENGQQAKAGAALNTGTANAAGYVGSDTCMTCHADVAKNFAANPHSRLALMHGGKGVTCESCHGPGQAHVDDGGDITKIFLPSKAAAKQVDATCLGCHAGVHPNFERSPHAKAGLSCISCHSIHAPQSEQALLKLPQPTLCMSCHTDVKGSFDMPFHHPVNEGAVNCTDCHDVHGTFQNSNLRITADQNTIRIHRRLPRMGIHFTVPSIWVGT